MRALLFAFAFIALPAHAQDGACLDAFASRYIGETERNLGRYLALARQSDAVLSYEEADALFGHRTDRSAARDRFANQEVAALLARIERYERVEHLVSYNRRTLIAGFGRRAPNAALVLVRTDTGVRVLEFRRADRRRALDYAAATFAACPVR